MSRLVAAVTCLILLAAVPAFADDLTGRLGLTGGAGILISHSSDDQGALFRAQRAANFTGGGGLIYGISRNFAATAEAAYLGVGIRNSDDQFDCADASLGLQYRFRPDTKYVPYIGAGADVIFPTLQTGSDKISGQTILGGHLKAGIDIFMTKHFAFMAESKALLGPKSEIKDSGVVVDQFDPTSISVVVGYRVIF